MKHPFSTDMDPPAMILSMKVGCIDGPLPLSVDVMIDTGADMTVLPAQLVQDLGVKQRGHIDVWAAFDKEPEKRDTFLVKLQLGSGPVIEIEVLASDEDTGLLGRDVLNDFILVADGPKELFELTSSEPE